jgi:hypothetical protein
VISQLSLLPGADARTPDADDDTLWQQLPQEARDQVCEMFADLALRAAHATPERRPPHEFP